MIRLLVLLLSFLGLPPDTVMATIGGGADPDG